MRRVHGKLNLVIDAKKGIGDALSMAIFDALKRGTVNGLKEMAPTFQKMPEHNRYLTKHFHQFTGNTMESVTANVIDAGSIVGVFDDPNTEAVHELVRLGETVHLDDPVEGKPRSVTGQYDISGYASDYSDTEAGRQAKSVPFAGIVLAGGPAYAPGITDVWMNAFKEMENYVMSSKFAWHIRQNIARASNNYGK